MTALAWLIPAALALGGLGLAAFLWALNSGQFDDLDGAAWRALDDRDPAPRSVEPYEVVKSMPGGVPDHREGEDEADKTGQEADRCDEADQRRP
ncbi:MAG: cbb3-type cytochrome oxidase assembly protein CcoS [Hyphomicrobiaceae bacterium]